MSEFSEEWAKKPLGEIADFVFRGISYSSKVMTEDPKATPMVNLKNVGKGGGFREDGFKYYTGPSKKGVTLEPGDLLIANTDLSTAKDVLGSPIRIPQSLEGRGAAFTHHMTKIIPNTQFVTADFLQYFFESPIARAFMKKNGSGTTVMNLQTRALPSLEVPLPPLESQRRIVETLKDHLDRLDKALSEVVEGRRLAESLIRSIRHDVFSPGEVSSNWDTTNIGQVLVPMNGKRHTQRGWSPQCLNHVRQSEDIWGVLKTTAIQLGDFQPQHHKELPRALEPKPEIEVKQGDLIMTATGPRNRCGIPCLVESTPGRLMMSGKMFRFRTNSSICEPRWLLEFLLSDAGQNQLESLKVGSSDSSVSIGADQFERIQMPLPSLQAQNEILQAMDEKIARARQFVQALESTSLQADTLRRSLLHSTFTGQLTTEEPNV